MSDTGRYNFTAFAAQVVERARQIWPDNLGITLEGRTVKVMRPRAGDDERDEISINLSRSYREYWTSGDLAHVMDLLFGSFFNPPVTREEIQARAMVKFDHAKLLEGRARLYWPFEANPENVIITGVLDYPGNMKFFDEGGERPELEQYSVTKDEFWEWGMAHLRTLVTERFTPTHLVFDEQEWRGQELWVLSNGSGYASAALLCHDIIDSWMPRALKRKWVAGIPDRDTLVIAKPDAPAELLASAMAKGRADGLYPFDWTIYTVKQGQIVNFWGTLNDAQLRKLASDTGLT